MLEVMSRADRLQKCGSLKRTHSSPGSPSCQGIEFDHVNVIAPSGKLLARDLTFQVFLALSACIHGLSTPAYLDFSLLSVEIAVLSSCQQSWLSPCSSFADCLHVDILQHYRLVILSAVLSSTLLLAYIYIFCCL